MDTYNSTFSEQFDTAHISPPITGSSQINVGNTERIISAVGGALLTYYGLRKPNTLGLAMAAVGGSLLFRGATGYCPVSGAIGLNTAENESIAIEITRSLTILKPRNELYQYWRQLENLPNFMQHLQDVRQMGPKHSHWIARMPKGIGTVEWDADIIQEEKNTLLAWRSLPGSDIDNAGEVRFMDAPANRGTVVQATISYRPPAGAVGGGVAKLLNPVFKQIVKEDLRRFKRLMETGEISTIEGQPSGRA
ncbi:YgaP-like transmembrane domain [Pontibacter silvestris]|uniref:YgaP-like transmembrane domain n=1 Tax=Pontibacter silvestris TaxID=2305183 RepID=A0ABW4X321_9BACT|nr:YgaP-like transmembrane domain [Pontibacter silvestris]MCC9134994.1 DUF2892 domain-containing protein [Pontibacter silvestris]